MDINPVKIFFSSQRIHSGQTFPLFCTLELIRNSFWPNMLFMPPLCHTTTLLSRISNFVLNKQKLVILTDMQDPNLTSIYWYFYINTVTERQKSVHGFFPLLESNLGLWDGNRFFTNELLKCWIPRATKEFT